MLHSLSKSTLKGSLHTLSVGQEIAFTGTVYMMRDQAHKRLCDAIRRRKKLPVDLRGMVVYYCGPTRTPRGHIIGSCGPTTSSRMDPFAPLLLKHGVKGMIGKGARSPSVVDTIRRFKAVYFLAPAGCGALLATKVNKMTLVAYPEFGPEAIRKCEVEDFPLIVGVDARGRSIYQMKPKLTKRSECKFDG